MYKSVFYFIFMLFCAWRIKFRVQHFLYAQPHCLEGTLVLRYFLFSYLIFKKFASQCAFNALLKILLFNFLKFTNTKR